MTNTPPPASLRERLVAALDADSVRPWGERQGLVNAMLTVVQPELNTLAAVDRLHQPRQHGGWTICPECSHLGRTARAWPCATATILAAVRATTS
ncbi:hypothetical protein ACWD4P_12735 [Kitasatospora sp. NPDC002543]